MISLTFKALRKLKEIIFSIFYNPIAKFYFLINGANIGKNLKVNGFIQVYITRRGKVKIGDNCTINSGHNHNIIGRQQKNIIWVEGNLIIGDNVGMSCTAIICNHNIVIGNNVTIGGNTVIYDTDFHSLDPNVRLNKEIDKASALKASVFIGDNVFIGAHSTILKGVVIGNNSIVGACSLVAKNIPKNEIWAGNPAKFIKNITIKSI